MTTQTLPKIYVFCNQKGCTGSGDWHNGIAIAEDGTALAGHVSSCHGWLRHDLGVELNGWKRDEYAKHYPNGFDVVFVENEDIDALLNAVPALRADTNEVTE